MSLVSYVGFFVLLIFPFVGKGKPAHVKDSAKTSVVIKADTLVLPKTIKYPSPFDFIGL